MGDLLEKLFLMSLQASVLVGIVLVLRILLKKAPRWIHVALWALVAVRLVFPVSWQTRVSLMPKSEFVEAYVSEITHVVPSPTPVNFEAFTTAAYVEIEGVGTAVYPTIRQDAVINHIPGIMAGIWAAGCGSLLIWGGVSYLRLKRKVGACVETEEGAYLCDEIESPFVLGLLRPKIYLPSTLEGKKRDFVLSHEKVHIKRRDNLIKPFAYLLLSVYWFNPVFWLAYFLLCRDIEAACDERVIKNYSRQDLALYSETLLSLSTSGGPLSACPVAFGETGVKQRVKNVLHYKKPAFWVILTALILSAAVSILFLTDRITDIRKKYPLRAPALEQAVSEALLAEVTRRSSPPYFFTECVGEGHVILQTEEKDGKVYVYAMTRGTGYAFRNGDLTNAASGFSGPLTVVLQKSETGYAADMILWPEDGESGAQSVRDMFPDDVEEDALSPWRFADVLNEMDRSYAEEYLRSIGRDAEVRWLSEQKHDTLHAFGVATSVEEEIEDNPLLAPLIGKFTLALGTAEYVEDGVRVVYEKTYRETEHEVIFRKYAYETNRTLWETRFSSLTGDVTFANPSGGDKSGFSEDAGDEVRFQKEWKLETQITNLTSTSATLIFHCGGYPSAESVGDPNGDEGTHLMTGEHYSIEVWRDGVWQPLETKTEPVFHTIGYPLPTEGEYPMEINWEWLYGALPNTRPGETYRLGKPVSFFNRWGMRVGEDRMFYFYFEID